MTREEAIKVVRNIYQTDAEKEALKTLIPELSESEDERIREQLIDAIKIGRSNSGISFTEEAANRYITLLEKQKEMPTNEEMLRTLRTEYEKGVADTIAKYEQKEQKPAEKLSKEDYVKKFKALCDAYEIKLPNRKYDIYHLCDDLSKLSIDSGKQKPIKLEVYEVGKGTTICGQDYKCKKDYKEGNCWYIKDVIYHCSRDGYLTDQNGVSWSCTPEWFKEYIYSNAEWAEKEKSEFVGGQFIQCNCTLDNGLKKGEHYWLEYVGDDTYVGRSDNILNQKFHITPRQLFTLFSQELEEVQGPPQEEKQVSLNYEPPFDENPSDREIIEALIKHLKEQNDFLTAIDSVSTKAILSWLEKQKEQTEELSTRMNGVMQEYVKAGEDEEEQEHRLKCYQLFWDALGDSEFFKQKEQPEEPKIAFGDWGDREKKEAIITCLKYMRFVKKITNEECKDLVRWLEDNLVSNVLEKDGWTIASEQTDIIKEDYYGAFLRGEMRGYLRAKKEQKPVTNDEQQECPYKDLVLVKDFFGKYKRKCVLSGKACEPNKCKSNKTVQLGGTFTSYDMAKTFIEGQDYVIKHPEKFNLCTSTEWSEEDERKLQKCIKIIERWEEDHDIAYSPYSNLLKSLRPQSKDELTLFDKNIINAAVAFVEQNDHFNCWGGIDKHTVIKALRSIKPHWNSCEQ